MRISFGTRVKTGLILGWITVRMPDALQLFAGQRATCLQQTSIQSKKSAKCGRTSFYVKLITFRQKYSAARRIFIPLLGV